MTYVPGSLKIDGVSQTDALGDEQGEYDDITHQITARLGTGADGTQGGTILKNTSSTVTFEVTVNADAVGTTIENQASISAAGKLGAQAGTEVTDGNGAGAGSPPTTVFVDIPCKNNADCSGTMLLAARCRRRERPSRGDA